MVRRMMMTKTHENEEEEHEHIDDDEENEVGDDNEGGKWEFTATCTGLWTPRK